jgi:hypothetical protein
MILTGILGSRGGFWQLVSEPINDEVLPHRPETRKNSQF